jgi:hypothetical protein
MRSQRLERVRIPEGICGNEDLIFALRGGIGTGFIDLGIGTLGNLHDLGCNFGLFCHSLKCHQALLVFPANPRRSKTLVLMYH